MTPGVTVTWVDAYNAFLAIISSGVNALLASLVALLFVPLLAIGLRSLISRR